MMEFSNTTTPASFRYVSLGSTYPKARHVLNRDEFLQAEISRKNVLPTDIVVENSVSQAPLTITTPQDRKTDAAAVIERCGVAAISASIATASGGTVKDWLSAAAVFTGFFYAQLSFDIADNSKKTSATSSPKILKQLWSLKEVLWIAAFAAQQNYVLVAGAAIFSCYPAIRTKLRGNQSEISADSRNSPPE